MLTLFNSDMGRRLADLWQALLNEDDISVQHLTPFEHQGHKLPDRISVKFGARSFVLDFPAANAVCDQLTENGYPVFAGRLRPPTGVA